MKKQIISCVLITFLSFCIGCYSTHTITRGELNRTTKEELKAEVERLDITVFTEGSLEYKFLKGNYGIQGDTLLGFGVQTIARSDVPFHGSISFSDIASVKTENFSPVKTIIVIGIPVGIIVGLSFWISYSFAHGR